MNEIEKAIDVLLEHKRSINVLTSYKYSPLAISHSIELAIQALQEKAEREKYPNGWIPVSERLPEKSGRYLVTYWEWTDGNFLPKYDITEVKISTFKESMFRLPMCIDNNAEKDTHREVLAWQPLPKLYEKKEGAE